MELSGENDESSKESSGSGEGTTGSDSGVQSYISEGARIYNSPHSEAWQDLGSGWRVTTYYTPVRGQKSYVIGSYEADFEMNCMGDCLSTASTYYLDHDRDQFKVAACPPNMPFGTRLQIEGIPHEVVCRDRGGAIKGKKIDLWVGIGDDAWIGKYSGKNLKIKMLTP